MNERWLQKELVNQQDERVNWMITSHYQDDGFARSRNTTKQAFTCHDLS